MLAPTPASFEQIFHEHLLTENWKLMRTLTHAAAIDM
jgi:hypothetical protein